MSNQKKLQTETLKALKKYVYFFKRSGDDNPGLAVTRQILAMVKEEPIKLAPSIRKDIIKRAVITNCFDNLEATKNIKQLESRLIFGDKINFVEIEKTLYLIAKCDDGITILDNLLLNNNFVMVMTSLAYTHNHLLKNEKKETRIIPFSDSALLDKLDYFYENYNSKTEENPKPKKERVKQYTLVLQ